MKHILLFCLSLFLSVPSFAEIISSVSFNPSRMGEYTYLKVADKANLKGGLNATTMNISSGGTVTMTTDTSSRIYDVPTVTGASGSAINMPNTAFHGNTSNTYSSYKSESTSVPSGLLPSVRAKGGTQTYNNDSYIQTLDAVNMLKQKVGTLKGGTLEITGNNGNSVDLYESGNTAGFYLAGNDIPEPTGAHTNTGANLTGCQLAWEKRKTSDSPAKEVYLLGLQGCNGSGGGSSNSCPSTACTAGTTKTENCSSGYTGSKTYYCDGYPSCNWRQVSGSCTAVQYYWRSMGTTSYVYGGTCNPAGGTCGYYYTSAGLNFGRVNVGDRCTAVGNRGYSSCSEYTSGGRCHMTYNVVSCQN